MPTIRSRDFFYLFQLVNENDIQFDVFCGLEKWRRNGSDTERRSADENGPEKSVLPSERASGTSRGARRLPRSSDA